jgi:hypothetical protein
MLLVILQIFMRANFIIKGTKQIPTMLWFIIKQDEQKNHNAKSAFP